MKKNIMKFLASLFVVAFATVSCTEDVVKSDYDYVPDVSKLPTLTLNVGAITGSTVALTGTLTPVGTDTAIIEKGFVCAKNADFTMNVVSKKVVSANLSGVMDNLAGDTDYFVKSYAVTINGIAYSEVKTFKTRKLVVVAEVDTTNLATYAESFSSIDKDGDGSDWELEYLDKEETKLGFVSYSWYDAALTPENYLLFPSINIPSGVILPELTVTLSPADVKFPAEGYKLIISDVAITSENVANATVLKSGKLTKDGVVLKISIPDSFIGKTIYLGLAHYDCTDMYAIIYKGHKFVVTQ